MTVPQKIKGRSFSAPAFAAPGMECRLFFTNVILMRFRQPVPKNSRRAFI